MNCRLSKREVEVLRLAAEGMTNSEIADHLFISRRTVDFHLFRIYKKLDASNRIDAMLKAAELGFISFDLVRA